MKKILEGKTLAAEIRNTLGARAAAAAAALGRPLKITGIGWAGDGAGYASYVYLKKEMEAAAKTGVSTEIFDITENTTAADFLELVKNISSDECVDAILIPRPLPKHLDVPVIWENLSAEKDIDGAATLNMGRLFECKNWTDVKNMSGFVPCTALAVMRLLEFHKIDLSGKEVAVIGRSAIVGRPLAHMVVCKDASVTICHSRTVDLPKVLNRADIVISAIGKARFVKENMVRPGAIVIDVGTNQDENGVFCGDVDFDAVIRKADTTPVPGGVGPVTLACLLENIVLSAERRVNLKLKD